MTRSFMDTSPPFNGRPRGGVSDAPPRGRPLNWYAMVHLPQSLARLAGDELADARVGALLQLVGCAVEQYLRFVRRQPSQRMQHDDAIGHFEHCLHVVRD